MAPIACSVPFMPPVLRDDSGVTSSLGTCPIINIIGHSHSSCIHRQMPTVGLSRNGDRNEHQIINYRTGCAWRRCFNRRLRIGDAFWLQQRHLFEFRTGPPGMRRLRALLPHCTEALLRRRSRHSVWIWRSSPRGMASRPPLVSEQS
jgi:hypothetical protein